MELVIGHMCLLREDPINDSRAGLRAPSLLIIHVFLVGILIVLWFSLVPSNPLADGRRELAPGNGPATATAWECSTSG